MKNKILMVFLLCFFACTPKEDAQCEKTVIGTDYLFMVLDSNATTNEPKKVLPVTPKAKVVETPKLLIPKTAIVAKPTSTKTLVAKKGLTVAETVSTNVSKTVSKTVPTPVKTVFIGYENRLAPITFYHRPKSFLTSAHTHTIGFQQ